MSIGTRISDMDSLGALPASGADIPIAKDGDNYRFDLAAMKADLDAEDAARPTSAALAAPTGATRIGITPSGTGAKSRTAAQVMDEVVYASGFTGYDVTGATDSYAAIMAADLAARQRNRDLVIQGVPKILSSIALNNPTRWRFEGTHFKPGQLEQGSYLQKAASLDGPALIIGPGAYGTIIEGGGIIGADGNLGDGLVIWGNSVTLRDFAVESMGRDGIRIGRYEPDDAYAGLMDDLSGVFNADSFFLDGVASGYNAGHGLVLSDGIAEAWNANAGCIDRPILTSNTLSGLYANKTYLGTEIVAGLFEANGRYGIELFTHAVLNFRGGDVEANTLGQILEETTGASLFDNVTVGGVIWNSRMRGGSFTPVLSGATTPGAGTYTTQVGRFSTAGGRVFFDIKLAWSAHTGTGQMVVSLPTGFLPDVNWSSAGKPDQTAVTVVNSGVDPGAGNRLVALAAAGAQRIELGAVSGSGVFSGLDMAASGSLLLSGSYETAEAVERL